MDDLHLTDELIAELEGLAIRTSQGSYIKVEEIRGLIERKRAAQEVQGEEIPESMRVEQARGLARRFLADQKFGEDPAKRDPGTAIPAAPHPSSRT